MKHMTLALAGVLALASVSPAAAEDALYDKRFGSLILADFHGKAIWELQAMCAGYHRATASYFSEQGKRDLARRAEVASAQATNRVALQLKHDRGLSRAEAIRLAAAYEQVGVRVTQRALAKDGHDQDGQWNYWKSFCADADRVFFAQTGVGR